MYQIYMMFGNIITIWSIIILFIIGILCMINYKRMQSIKLQLKKTETPFGEDVDLHESEDDEDEELGEVSSIKLNKKKQNEDINKDKNKDKNKDINKDINKDTNKDINKLVNEVIQQQTIRTNELTESSDEDLLRYPQDENKEKDVLDDQEQKKDQEKLQENAQTTLTGPQNDEDDDLELELKQDEDEEQSHLPITEEIFTNNDDAKYWNLLVPIVDNRIKSVDMNQILLNQDILFTVTDSNKNTTDKPFTFFAICSHFVLLLSQKSENGDTISNEMEKTVGSSKAMQESIKIFMIQVLSLSYPGQQIQFSIDADAQIFLNKLVTKVEDVQGYISLSDVLQNFCHYGMYRKQIMNILLNDNQVTEMYFIDICNLFYNTDELRNKNFSTYDGFLNFFTKESKLYNALNASRNIIMAYDNFYANHLATSIQNYVRIYNLINTSYYAPEYKKIEQIQSK